MAQETATEKKTNPIVQFLRIPEKYPDEAAYLWGMQCGACDAKFLGARLACGKCGETDKLSEVIISILLKSIITSQLPPALRISIRVSSSALIFGSAGRSTSIILSE